MRKRYWYLLSISGAALATLLVAGRPGTPNTITKKAEEICCKTKIRDCNKKDRENPMILESLSRQFIFISQ
jgi:hypothetical protein